MSLVKKPILDNCNLKGIPKVLVLQHCRGEDEIDRDSDSEGGYETDGAVDERRHRMVNFIGLKNYDMTIDMNDNVFIISLIFQG